MGTGTINSNLQYEDNLYTSTVGVDSTCPH